MDTTRFTNRLPLPALTALQQQIAHQILFLESLAETREAERLDASRPIHAAASKLAEAMDAAGIDRDEDDRRIVPYDEDGWKPWEAIERWILHDGWTTGSARVLAICYLAKTLGIKLKWKEVYGGSLDTARTKLATDLVKARQPAGLPLNFWRIYADYRESLVRELDYQDWKGWV